MTNEKRLERLERHNRRLQLGLILVILVGVAGFIISYPDNEPDVIRAKRIEDRLRDMRGGKVGETRFGARMRGAGVYWESVRDLFDLARERFGLDGASTEEMYDSSLDAESARENEVVQLGFDFG